MPEETLGAVVSRAGLLAGFYAAFAVLFVSAPPSHAADEAATKKVISAEDFAGSLKYIGIAVKKRDTHVWGTAPVIDRDTGKVHLFVAEWDAREMPFADAWWHIARIAHHVGDSPEGPFRFVDYVVKDVGGTFNSPCNPMVSFIDGKYVLVFIVNEHNDKTKQHIVMYIADSPNGPWRPARGEADGTVLRTPTDPAYWSYKSVRGVTNPSLLKYGDKYHLYYKSVEPAGPDGNAKGPYRYGVAIADAREGPYVHRKKPVTDMSIELEDGYFFTQADGKVYMVSRDYRGKLGSHGGGLIWVSDDGLFFPANSVKTAHQSLSNYTKKSGGGTLERAQILKIDGQPAYLYLCSRSNVSGERGSCSYVFEIKQKGN